MMKLKKIVRDEAFVRFVYQKGGKLAMEELTHTFHEAPMKSFDDAFQELGAVAVNWLEVGKEYTKDLTVTALSFTYTKHGTRSAAITAKKILDVTDTLHTIDTPHVQIDEAQGEEETRRECTKGQAEKVYAMIAEAEKYLSGERQQLILPLVTQAAEPEDGDAIVVNIDKERKRAHG